MRAKGFDVFEGGAPPRRRGTAEVQNLPAILLFYYKTPSELDLWERPCYIDDGHRGTELFTPRFQNKKRRKYPMRNLKRVLSLALATFMLIGMMVVGAGAVDTYNDFTDKDEIVNTDAVSLLVTLGVINGKEDGSSFDPTGNVTRAEMAKMISTILNRGTDINNQYAGMNSNLSDIANNWAVGHINYCYTLGIIAGRGDGRFDPTANVTASEAAKMLLVAAGYDANIQGLVGAQWDVQTSALASRLGIFDNFDKDITLALNRDDAALLIYNFLDIEMIQSYSNEQYPIAYADHRTVLSFAYGVIKVEGVVTGNEWAVLDGDSDTALQKGKTRITNPNGIFSTTTNTTVDKDDANVTTQIFNIATPEDYLGRSVTMYIRKTTILADSIVYATPVVKESNVVITDGAKILGGKAADDNSLAALLRGTGLVANEDTEFYLNYGQVNVDVNSNADYVNRRGATLTVIDNNDDGYVDYVLSKQKTLTHVSAVNGKKETTTLYAVEVVDNADLWTPDHVVLTDALKKDDIVLFVQYGGRTYVEYPDSITGQMDHFNAKNQDLNQQYMVVEDKQYRGDELVVLSNHRKVEDSEVLKFYVRGCDAATDDNGVVQTLAKDNVLKGVQFKSTYEFFLDDYDNIIAFREVEKAPTNYALVLGSAYSVNGLRHSGDMKILLNDGTTKTFKVDIEASADEFKSSYENGNDALAQWYGASAIDDDNKLDAVMKFMGTDDGGYNNGTTYIPTKNGAAGNLIAYTYDEEEDTITFIPAELDLGSWVNGNASMKDDKFGKTGNNRYFFGVEEPMKNYVLTHDLDKGDTDLFFAESNNATSNDTFVYTDSYGIDEDTIIYYYNSKGEGSVVKGYDAMAKSIKKDGSGKINKAQTYTIDYESVAVSMVAFNDDTDVIEVMVVYTDQAVFGNDDYVYVMSVYNKYSNGYYTYTVIDKEGNVKQMRSKNSNMAGKLCTYAAKDDYYVLTAQGDFGWHGEQDSAYAVKTEATPLGLPNWRTYGAADVANDVGLVVTTRTQYVKVYDFDRDNDGGIYLDPNDDNVINENFVDAVEDGTLDDYQIRYADKALVIDVENTDQDDDVAQTTTCQNGQYAIVVYNDRNRAEVIYVLKSYKWEADPEKETADTREKLDYLSINNNAILTGREYGYKTLTDAVNNAYVVRIGQNELGDTNAKAEAYAIYDDSLIGGATISYGTANSKGAALSWSETITQSATGWVSDNGMTPWRATLKDGTYIIVAVDKSGGTDADFYVAFVLEID